tara:strand:- start:222 stop:821 length:600 start_codon:yes stop_codon:yes gene_type:complete
LNNFIFFSNNQNKIKEIKKLFLKSGIKILSLNDLNKTENYMAKIEPKEIGNSFAANAKIKSLYGFKRFNMPCFADDSGICISSLKNKPGINSKYFFENFKNKKDAFNFIINKCTVNQNTSAYFKTSICLCLKINHYIVFEGTVTGNISLKAKGKNGFGYDPLFIPSGHDKTFAEMSIKEKNYFSHRSIAINKLKKFIVN